MPIENEKGESFSPKEEFALAASFKTLLFGRLDCAGSDSMQAENSSLDFLADLGETRFIFVRLSSDSSVESMMMEEHLIPDPLTWIAWIKSFSSPDESQ